MNPPLFARAPEGALRLFAIIRSRLRSRARGCASTALALGLLGCSATQPVAPMHYPALPALAPGSEGEPAFVPAPALSPITLACRASEAALANALDDDCDGNIDAASPGPLSLAVAYPRALGLALSLRPEQGPAHQLDVSTCAESAPFCTTHVSIAGIARGKYTLVAAKPEQSAATGSVLVSVQSHGQVSAYLANISAEEPERALGSLSLP